MSHKLLELNETTDDQLVIIREFNAPQKLVFEVLSQHHHVKNWACPKGMTISSISGELQEGGTYTYTMESPKGHEMVLTGTYREVNPYSKLIYTQSYVSPDGNQYPETLITITLERVGSKTQMIFHHTGFPAKQDRDNASMGWPSAFEKLENLIHSLVQ